MQIAESYAGQFNGHSYKIEIAPMTQEIYKAYVWDCLTWPHSDRMEDALPDDQRFVSFHNGEYARCGDVATLRPRAGLTFTRTH